MIFVVVVVATALVSAMMNRVSLFMLRTTGSDVGVPKTSPVTARCDGRVRGQGTTGMLRWRATLFKKSAYALRAG
jgi:hypothetical protein